jgi:glutamate---cysteine ligase / carboxylate-amine ligase
MATERTQRTVGVEEELLLFDRGTTHLARSGDALADPETGSDLDGTKPTVEHEFKRAQIETATTPQVTMAGLRADIEQARREVGRRAAESNAVVVALATDPAPSVPLTTRDERYARMVELYAAVADQQLACGMHVHVAVESRDEGVQVIDRIRAWLPVLLALSANSPYHQGRDTGYASFRGVMWGLWPTSGATDIFGSVDAYQAEVDALVATGAAVDEGMIYFDARLAVRYPTVEIRVMDVTPTPDDAVLLAALCRSLVDTAAEEAQRGVAASDISRARLRAAGWRAARFGLTGDLVAPGRPEPSLQPAADAVRALVDHVGPALRRNGDEQLVQSGLARLLEDGNGADRQRAVFSQSASIADVIAAAVAWTGAAATS